MCGIVGIWGDKPKDDLTDMMQSLRHRGPDAEGACYREAGALGHRRLSIMDPEGGDQPLYNENGSMAVIANGEIYNFRELKRKLVREHRFSTTSDTEALIHAYEEMGPAMVNELDGMFAFAIADGLDLFAARDPIGIKPLYFAEQGDGFWFASELKTLAPHCEKVHEFPPGTAFHSKQGFSTFYTVPELNAEDRAIDDFIRELRTTLERAVTKRLMSNVPLGAFLSGGVDSSIIAAVARQHIDKLHTFTVGVEGSRDLEAARIVSRHLDTIHHEYILSRDELREKLPDIIYYLESFDQDLVRSAIPCYFTSRLAAEYVKVILTGEGADELFAGYTYYKGIDNPSLLQQELRRSVASLHNINLQRVDRMTMAHSIEGRVPFLDVEMIRLGQRIPPRLKLDPHLGPEKWILRKAFEDLLPSEILWRDKEQFDEGSGTVDLVEHTLNDMIDTQAMNVCRDVHTHADLRSAEEALYHRLFMEVYDHPEPILDNVARWADRPEWIV
jgi:asparagine synthase (glutamine-hydrolysing)